MAVRVTFDELTAAEPRLAGLWVEALQVDGSPPHFCAIRVWLRDFKPRLVQLVGWERARHHLLGTETAYDVAYDTVYNALPNCRDCGCP